MALRWEKIAGFIIILPTVVALLIFVYGFIGWTGWVSLSNWSGGAQPDYTYGGFDAYARLFGLTDKYAAGIDARRFAADIRNVVSFTLVFIVSSVVIGFTLAALLDRHIVGEPIFRAVFLFPMALSFIVTGLAWRWLFTPGDPAVGRTGLNLLFEQVGLGWFNPNWSSDIVYHLPADSGLGQLLGQAGLAWLSQPKIGVSLGVITLAIAAVWPLSGYTMAICLAGLRNISNDLREAARVDGASEWQVYRYIIIPLLKPVTVSVIIVLAYTSLKIYDLVVAMGGTGEGFAKDMPALNMWDTTYGQSRFAQGAAIGVVLLIFVSFLIVPYLSYSLRQQREQQ